MKEMGEVLRELIRRKANGPSMITNDILKTILMP